MVIDKTDWAHDWKMQFNESKCKVVHIKKNNSRYEYLMNGEVPMEAFDAKKNMLE